MPRNIESSNFFPSVGEKNNQSPKEQQPQIGFDVSDIEKQINEVLAHSEEYTNAEKEILLRFLLTEDPDRGLEALDVFNLPPQTIGKIINSWQFAIHQPGLWEKFCQRIEKDKDIENQLLRQEMLDKREQIKKKEIPPEHQAEDLSPEQPENISLKIKNLIKSANQYYDLLRGEKKAAPQKKFSMTQTFSSGEELAKELAETNEGRGVYTGAIRDYAIKNGLAGQDPDLMPIIRRELNISSGEFGYDQWKKYFKKMGEGERETIIKRIFADYLRSKFADAEELIGFLSQPTVKDEKALVGFRRLFGVDEKTWQMFVKKNWTRSTVAPLLKINAEKELKKELLDSLRSRYPNRNIELIKENGGYLVAEKDEGERPNDGLKNIKKETRTEYRVNPRDIEQAHLCGEKLICEECVDDDGRPSDDWSRMVVEDVPNRAYNSFSEFKSTEDGEHYGYIGKRELKGKKEWDHQVVYDGKPDGLSFGLVKSLQMGPKGSYFYVGFDKGINSDKYIAINSNHCHGTTDHLFDSIAPCVFSPDGDRLAYIGRNIETDGRRDYLVIDEKTGAKTDKISQEISGQISNFQFSSDGRHYIDLTL